VAVIETYEKEGKTFALPHFNEKITSDSSSYGGVHPIVAHESHQKNLAALIDKSLERLPLFYPTRTSEGHLRNALYLQRGRDGGEQLGVYRKKPDFITVTRGPGMRANLITGIDTAKGLAVAWQVPLLGINHMQAHALTPRMVVAMQRISEPLTPDVKFPFLTLLVSGGHTMLVHSTGVCDHKILANTTDIAVGDMIDKCAREILPEDVLNHAGGGMYGPHLEKFAFPDLEVHRWPVVKSDAASTSTTAWSITPPLLNHTPSEAKKYNAMFSFSGIGSSVKRFVDQNPIVNLTERQSLARETMRVAFKHLASRVIIALQSPELAHMKTLVVSGGVASNQYLKHVIRSVLDENGHKQVELIFPPVKFCTDNAAMIAWAGIEMWGKGYRTCLDATVLRKWSIDPKAEDGGILGADGWKRVRLKEAPN
jgi:N6-L-threonylcarbamoyladenine synthase